MKAWFSGLWTRLFLRGVHYGDRYRQLDTLYRLENPWRLDGEPEQARFRLTNELILKEFGRVDTLLEIGSGEGHQSTHLMEVCGHLSGREISQRAVERAQARHPQASYVVGDLSIRVLGEPAPYDLVVACEVLYYMSDPQGAVEEMSRLGRGCVVTYYQTQKHVIDGQVRFPDHAGRTELKYGDGTWTAVWWRNPA